MTVGLVLGGGAAKGLAHIGVLKELGKSGIPIDLVVGTSMGALIGALFCQSRKAEEVESAVQNALKCESLTKITNDIENLILCTADKKEHSLLDIFRRLHLYYQALKNHGVVEDKRIILAISNLLPEFSLEELKPKFASVASDLHSGESVIFTKGSVREAVRASISVPLLFPPYKVNGRLLVDGMVTSLVPVEEARLLGADLVIAVDVQGSIEREEAPQNAVEIMVRCQGISCYQLKKRGLKNADIVIRPFSEKVRSWDFNSAQDYIDLGQKAAGEKIGDIKKMLKGKDKKDFLDKLIGYLLKRQ